MRPARRSNLQIAVALACSGLLLCLLFALPLTDIFIADIPLRMSAGRLPVPGMARTVTIRSSYWQRKPPAPSHPFLDPLHAAAPEALRSTKPQLRRRADESLAEWLAMANAYVYRLTDHCDTIESFAGPKDSPGTAMYGINVAGAAACGLCGQRAYWLASLLREGGIRGMLLGLMGHVVLAVPDAESGRHWVLDPDYGTEPFLVDLASSEEMRGAAAHHYRFLAETGRGALLEMLVGFFATTEDNAFYDMSYLAHLEFLQSRWLIRLWPSVMAGLRQEARSWTKAPTTGSSVPRGLEVARALHAAFVAAERKYGIAGHRTQEIELNAEDFLSQSRITDPLSGRYLFTVVNWGYRTIRLGLRGDARSGCRLHVDAGGAIVVPPHSSLAIDPGPACSLAGPTGTVDHVD